MWHLTLLDIIAATSHLHKDPMSGLEDNKEQGQMDVNAPDESMPSTKEQVVLKNCFLAFFREKSIGWDDLYIAIL